MRSGPVVVTDSSACLPDRPGLRVVPLRVHLDDRECDDDPAATSRVRAALAVDEPVKTSPPAAAEYLFELEGAGVTEALIVTPAHEFTSIDRNARLAADHASVRVEVVDSRTAAAGQALVVEAALAQLEAGAGLDAARQAASDAIRRATLVATIDSLGHLQRSGRVDSKAIDLASRFGVRPVFRLHQGSVVPVAIPRSPRDALRQLVEWWAHDGGPAAERVLVFHDGRRDEARRLARTLGDAAEILTFSPAMTVHTGPGVLGVAWLRP